MFRSSKLCLALAPLLVLAACGGEGSSDKVDAAVDRADSAVNDAAVNDAAVSDAAVADAAVADAAVEDAGEPDSGGLADADVEDAGGMDAAPGDAMPMDGGMGEGVLILSEIIDGDLTGGQPKFIEITNVGDAAVDLSQYSVGIFFNGNTSLSSAALVLEGSLAAGDSHVVHYSSDAQVNFTDVYGFPPDAIGSGNGSNGDDTIALFLGAATGDGSDATLVDVYGVLGTDGTGQPWEFLDGYVVRAPSVVTPSATFTEADWTIANGALDGLDAAQHAATTSPGTHTFTP